MLDEDAESVLGHEWWKSWAEPQGSGDPQLPEVRLSPGIDSPRMTTTNVCNPASGGARSD